MLWLQKQTADSWHRAATEQPGVTQEPPVSGLGVGNRRAGHGGRGRWKTPLQSLGYLSALPLTSSVTLGKSLPLLSFPSVKCTNILGTVGGQG